MVRGRSSIAIAVTAFALACSARAHAQAADAPVNGASRSAPDDGESGTADLFAKRKYTIMELDLGAIVLPNAPISPAQRGGSLPIGTLGHGDATASVGLHFLYRGGPDWAIGAGALFSPLPTSDPEYGSSQGYQQTHSRSYMWLGTEARYIPLRLRTLEGWIGFTVGAVIVADRFESTAPSTPSEAFTGPPEVTVRTEGVSVGVQAGGDWAFTERLTFGLAVRVDNWILPATPLCSPIGDCATLTGPVSEFEIGFRLGYRIPL
jgi:hypothetical protein